MAECVDEFGVATGVGRNQEEWDDGKKTKDKKEELSERGAITSVHQ